MLIVSEYAPLTAGRLRLPDWIRAPLYLGASSRYFAAMESHRHANGNIELLISSIEHTLWDDLWRIEVDTSDEAGNALILMSLLEDRGLEILAAESSTNTFSQHHSTTLLLSAAGYSGEFDLSSRERSTLPRPQLQELQREIFAYLGDKLVFKPEGKPSLKVSHMRTYRKLNDDLKSGARFIVNRAGSLMEGDELVLAHRVVEHIEKALGPLQSIEYSAAVDTKDRTISVIFFGSEHPRRFHMKVAVRADLEHAISNIYRDLYDAGGSVVRTNVRPCPPQVAERVLRITGAPIYLDEIQYKTVDITFEFPKSANVDEGLEAARRFWHLMQNRNTEGEAESLILRASWDLRE